MRVLTKLFFTILILFAASIVISLVVKSLGNRVSTGGIGPFIIYPLVIAGIAAVWKYKPEQSDNFDNN